MNTGIAKIEVVDGRAERLILDSGEEVDASVILPRLACPRRMPYAARIGLGIATPSRGKLSFTETISTFGKPMKDFGWEKTRSYSSMGGTFPLQVS